MLSITLMLLNRLKCSEHHANLLTHLVDVHVRIAQIMAIDHNLAAGGFFESIQATQYGGFTGTGRSDDANHLALAYRKIDAFDDFRMAIVFMQILDAR